MRLLAAFLSLLAAGCVTTARTVVTDVQVIEKPVPVPCRIAWPALPTPHVANVQLTGKRHVDALLIWRAAEAELEERISYERKLEAAAKACADEADSEP